MNTTNKTMKMNKTATKLKPGMTLIEITVVILVLLTLIAVLFIGANIYKRGADRAACILNQRNIQQAVRADQNLNNKGSSAALSAEIICGPGLYLEVEPTCPSDKATAYAWVSTIPDIGALAAHCGLLATYADHVPQDISGW